MITTQTTGFSELLISLSDLIVLYHLYESSGTLPIFVNFTYSYPQQPYDMIVYRNAMIVKNTNTENNLLQVMSSLTTALQLPSDTSCLLWVVQWIYW